MYYKRTQHSYPDSELVNALKISAALGVSPAAITKAKQSGRMDTFENSKGKELFHEVLSVQQFLASRDRRHVTVATQGQKKAGFDNMMAQAVAHKTEFDIPGMAPQPTSADVQAFDFGAAMAEKMDLETSKAQKEYYMARLAKLKADEMEGRLVPKQVCAINVYQIASNVQDKVMTIYSWLAPEIVGQFRDRMAKAGVSSDLVQAVTADADHFVGELIRKGCLQALKDLVNKNPDNILD